MKILKSCKRVVAVIMLGPMVALSMPVIPAQAEIVSTDSIIEQAENSDRAQLEALLAREDVQAELEKLGISATEAEARIAALSDDEVSMVFTKIDTLPAGQGAVGAIVGAALIVFLVLLITDLLGWTEVFGFTKKGAISGN